MMYFVKNLPKFDLCSMVKIFDLLLMYILGIDAYAHKDGMFDVCVYVLTNVMYMHI